LEPTPSNAGIAAFIDFQRLSFWPTTPALLDNAGVGTNPGTADEPLATSLGSPSPDITFASYATSAVPAGPLDVGVSVA